MFNQFARYEHAFADWRRDGYPGIKPDTYDYIDFLSAPDNDQAPREGTLWQHQWEAFLRVVYAHEILGKKEIGKKVEERLRLLRRLLPGFVLHTRFKSLC